MKRNGIWLIALVMAMGLIAGGCGDDDDDGGDDGAEALTKEEYLAQGNQICKQGEAELDAVADETFSGGEPDQATLEAFVNDALIPNVQGQIDQLRDLGIPEADEEQVTQILDEAELALQDIKEDPSLAAGQGGEDPFAEVNTKLDEYGLTACGGGG
jgi:hypothetical protein